MGVEVAIAVVSLAVTAVSAYEQQKQSKAAAKDRKKAGQVSQAEQAAQQTQNRRQQVREERIRRAQITQASSNTGVSGSSGELGSQSALGSLISGNLAASTRQQNSATAIGNFNQSAADRDVSAATWGAVGGFAGSIFGMSASAAMTKTSPTTVQPQPNTNQTNIFGLDSNQAQV